MLGDFFFVVVPVRLIYYAWRWTTLAKLTIPERGGNILIFGRTFLAVYPLVRLPAHLPFISAFEVRWGEGLLRPPLGS